MSMRRRRRQEEEEFLILQEEERRRRLASRQVPITPPPWPTSEEAEADEGEAEDEVTKSFAAAVAGAPSQQPEGLGNWDPAKLNPKLRPGYYSEPSVPITLSLPTLLLGWLMSSSTSNYYYKDML